MKSDVLILYACLRVDRDPIPNDCGVDAHYTVKAALYQILLSIQSGSLKGEKKKVSDARVRYTVIVVFEKWVEREKRQRR